MPVYRDLFRPCNQNVRAIRFFGGGRIVEEEFLSQIFNHIPSKTAGRYPTSDEAAALKFLLLQVDCQSKVELIGKAIIVLVGHPRIS